MDKTASGLRFTRTRPALRRNGPPASAWIVAVVSVALGAGFVVAAAMFRGLSLGPRTPRLLVISGVTTLLLLALFLAVLMIPWISPRVRRWSQLVLGLSLAVAGVVHFFVTREHLEESTLLGVGFIAAGLLQILLAALFLVAALRNRWAREACFAVVLLNAALVFLYGVHVWLGLPLGGEATGATLGSQEQIDLPGTVTKLAELVSLVLAFVALSSFRRVAGPPDDGSRYASSSA